MPNSKSSRARRQESQRQRQEQGPTKSYGELVKENTELEMEVTRLKTLLGERDVCLKQASGEGACQAQAKLQENHESQKASLQLTTVTAVELENEINNNDLEEKFDMTSNSLPDFRQKHESDLITVGQKVDSLQCELDPERQAHAETGSQQQCLVQVLRAEMDSLRQNMREEMKILQQSSLEKEKCLQRTMEELKTQLDLQYSLNADLSAQLKAVVELSVSTHKLVKETKIQDELKRKNTYLQEQLDWMTHLNEKLNQQCQSADILQRELAEEKRAHAETALDYQSLVQALTDEVDSLQHQLGGKQHKAFEEDMCLDSKGADDELYSDVDYYAEDSDEEPCTSQMCLAKMFPFKPTTTASGVNAIPEEEPSTAPLPVPETASVEHGPNESEDIEYPEEEPSMAQLSVPETSIESNPNDSADIEYPEEEPCTEQCTIPSTLSSVLTTSDSESESDSDSDSEVSSEELSMEQVHVPDLPSIDSSTDPQKKTASKQSSVWKRFRHSVGLRKPKRWKKTKEVESSSY